MLPFIVRSLNSTKDLLRRDKVTIARLTKDKAFSLFTKIKLTVYQYNIIKNVLENIVVCITNA